jgi:transposase
LKEQANIAIVCEATGGYEISIVQSLAQPGIRVSWVNPHQARDFAKAMGKLANTEAMVFHYPFKAGYTFT